MSSDVGLNLLPPSSSSSSPPATKDPPSPATLAGGLVGERGRSERAADSTTVRSRSSLPAPAEPPPPPVAMGEMRARAGSQRGARHDLGEVAARVRPG